MTGPLTARLYTKKRDTGPGQENARWTQLFMRVSHGLQAWPALVETDTLLTALASPSQRRCPLLPYPSSSIYLARRWLHSPNVSPPSTESMATRRPMKAPGRAIPAINMVIRPPIPTRRCRPTPGAARARPGPCRPEERRKFHRSEGFRVSVFCHHP